MHKVAIITAGGSGMGAVVGGGRVCGGDPVVHAPVALRNAEVETAPPRT